MEVKVLVLVVKSTAQLVTLALVPHCNVVTSGRRPARWCRVLTSYSSTHPTLTVQRRFLLLLAGAMAFGMRGNRHMS